MEENKEVLPDGGEAVETKAEAVVTETETVEPVAEKVEAIETEATPAPVAGDKESERGIVSAADNGGEYFEDTDSPKAAGPESAAALEKPGKLGSFFRNKVHPLIKAAWQKQPFLVLLFFGLALRILCVFLFKGYRPDITAMTDTVKKLMADGSKYYASNSINYAPGQLFIFYYIGLFTRWFNLTDGGAGAVFFLKLPSLLADLGIACLLYGMTKKFVNKKTALAASALYLFNPAILFAFSIWGGTHAVFVFFLVLTLRYMLDRKYLQTCFAYAAAVLFSASALTVAPLILIFLIVSLAKASSAYVHREGIERKASEGLLSLQKYNAVWQVPVGLLAFFVSLLLVTLPFTVKGIETGKSFALFSYFTIYKDLSLDFAVYTNNAFSVYGFVKRNGTAYEMAPGFMIGMYFFMCAILAAVYLMKRNRANLTLLSAFLYFILAYFMANANPLSAVSGLIILLVACIAIGDRRLYGQYLILSAVCLFNISAVMISAQYMNNLPDYLLSTTTNSAYGGAAKLTNGLMIAGSATAMAAFVYFMYIVMDITVANRRKIFMPFDPENPHYSFDTFVSIFK